jgi:hypothetical protein
MKLTEYVAQLCNALETPNPEGKVVTINLPVEHKAYRAEISRALMGVFLGNNSFILDCMFESKIAVFKAHEDYKTANQAGIKAMEQMNAKVKTIKPKRVIQSAPKKGGISKKKIEAAVNKIRKPKQEFPVGD